MEAIAAGSAVVAFISLAGQITQGCLYIRTLLVDASEAAEDIRHLGTEVHLFELTVDDLRKSLVDLDDAGIPEGQTNSVQLALDYSDEAVTGLVKLIAKNKKLGGRWGQVKFAFAKEKCAKYISRLERAKGYISTAQAGILLSLKQQQALSTRATHSSLAVLTSTLDITSSTIATIPNRINELSLETRNNTDAITRLRGDFSSRLHDLSTGINDILTSKFTTIASIFSEKLERVENGQHTALETRAAISNLQTEPHGLSSLPMGMPELVKNTFRGVLAEFCAETRVTPQVDDKAVGASAGIIALPLLGSISRRIVSQQTAKRTYIRAIGIIGISSITTTFCDSVEGGFSNSYNTRTSSVTETHIDLNPNPDFLRLGVYWSFVQQGFASFKASPEPILRVFNVVDTNAPIVIACATGDISRVRILFANSPASPFDRIWGTKSLLDLVLLRVILAVESSTKPSPGYLSNLLNLFELLVQHGVDPGAPRSNDDKYGASPLGTVALLTQKARTDNDAVQLKNLARTIVSHSTYHPLSEEDIAMLVWTEKFHGVKVPLLDFIEKQEVWPVAWPGPDELRNMSRRHFREVLAAMPAAIHRSPRDLEKLEKVLVYEYSALFLNQILQDCINLDEKLTLLTCIPLLYQHKYSVKTSYLQGVIKEDASKDLGKFTQDCLRSCKESGLWLLNTIPDQFHLVISAFRKASLLTVLRSALFALEVEDVDGLLENELYASLVYQLAHISQASEAAILEGEISRELEYCAVSHPYAWYRYLGTMSYASNQRKVFDAFGQVDDTYLTDFDFTNLDFTDLDFTDLDFTDLDFTDFDYNSLDDTYLDATDQDELILGMLSRQIIIKHPRHLRHKVSKTMQWDSMHLTPSQDHMWDSNEIGYHLSLLFNESLDSSLSGSLRLDFGYSEPSVTEFSLMKPVLSFEFSGEKETIQMQLLPSCVFSGEKDKEGKAKRPVMKTFIGSRVPQTTLPQTYKRHIARPASKTHRLSKFVR